MGEELEYLWKVIIIIIRNSSITTCSSAWWSIIIIGLIIATTSFWLCWFWYNNNNNKQVLLRHNHINNNNKVPKGNKGWPVLGETIEFIASGFTSQPVSFMEKRRSMYGKVFKTHILGRAIIVSTDSEVNKIVLQNQGNTFIPAYPKSITELLGQNSILQINGPLHKRVHALIGGFLRTPIFKATITQVIHHSVQLNLASWSNIQLLYVQDQARKITFEVLMKVLMSLDPGEDLNSLKEDFEEFIKGLICLPIKLPTTRLYKSLKAKERLLKIVGRLVEERKATMENRNNNNKERGVGNDVVDVLLQESYDSDESRRLPLDFITGNIIEMMIPGEETVPMAMTLAVKYLSDNPVVLDHLREENMELKKKKMIDNLGNCTWTDYMECLPFTQNVISETLRLANIINGVWRKATKDVDIKGYFIPKNWCVLASFISVHMNEENYEKPYEFNPWRWEKTGNTVNSNMFTPFGGGQRLCPGLDLSRLELAIFLHQLVTKYRWIAEKDEIVHFPTVKMKRKLPISVTSISMT